MSETAGHILRIGSQRLVDQVFDSTVYYMNIQRKWKSGQSVLFLHKTDDGDAFVGYGIVKKACGKEYLAEEDRNACEAGNWSMALEFLYVKRFQHPLLIRSTFLKETKLKGRYLHGLCVDNRQLKSVLMQAE
jgi:hypothetical protein